MTPMDCQGARHLLSLDLDGELGTETAFALARHLEVCAACARRFAAERRMEAGLRAAVLPPAEADPALWARLAAGLTAPARRRRFVPLAIAAAAVLVLAAYWLTRRAPAPHSLAAALAAMHDHVLDGTELPQADLSDPDAVATFFRERVPFTVALPGGVDVRGGRVCAVRGQKLALVFARDAGREVSLFTLPRSLFDAFPGEAVVSEHGAACVVLRAGPDTVRAAAAHLPAAHLQAMLDEAR